MIQLHSQSHPTALQVTDHIFLPQLARPPTSSSDARMQECFRKVWSSFPRLSIVFPPSANLLRSVASDTPSTLRRSTRQPMPVRRLDPTAAAKPATSQHPRAGPRPGSNDHTVQTLLKLPGFCFTGTNNVFNARDASHLATILGAQFEPGGNHRKAFPASDQRLVCVRVANVIEACCDEWLEDWQDQALTSDFWADAAERLRCYDKHWAAINATPVQVNAICMAYTGRWDATGRGDAPTDDEASWGFELGELTWGKAKAGIDPDLFAKPWEYERACESLITTSPLGQDMLMIQPPQRMPLVTSSSMPTRPRPNSAPFSLLLERKTPTETNLPAAAAADVPWWPLASLLGAPGRGPLP